MRINRNNNRLLKSTRVTLRNEVRNVSKKKASRILNSRKKINNFTDKTMKKMNLEEGDFKRVKKFIKKKLTAIESVGEKNSVKNTTNNSTHTNSTNSVSHSSGFSSISNEFLWKPVSESDGNLVILLPAFMTGDVTGVEILGPDGKPIAKGKPSGVHNGGRTHFRFDKPGQGFPNGSTVRVTLQDGSTQNININNTANRNTVNK